MTDKQEVMEIALPEPHGSLRRWPHLVIANYPVVGEVFRVLRPETIIGRMVDADVRPFHGKVSRRHARLLFDGDRLTIEDLGSSNGTLVSGESVTGRRAIAEGDIITLGNETKLGVIYSNIVDTAVRPPGSKLAADTADFIDEIRFGEVRSRALLTPLTFALVRVDASEPTKDGAETAHADETMRKIVAVVRDTVSASFLLARSSRDELVVVLRAHPEPAAVAMERIRLRIERATSLKANGPIPTTLTIAILATPTVGIWAPETILCALGDQGRRAMAKGRNRVVLLPPLDDQAQPPGDTEEPAE